MSPPIAYTLIIISADDLPERRFKLFSERRNVLVKAKAEGCHVQTKCCMCTSSPEWKETFQIQARKTSSVISLRVFASTLKGISLKSTMEIAIGDLLQRCLYEQDAEFDLRGMQSELRGRIKIRLSLSSDGGLIVSEAHRVALALVQKTDIPVGGSIDCIDDLLKISVPTPPAMAAQPIAIVLDKLSHFMRLADEAAKVHPYADLAWKVLSAAHKIIVAQLVIDRSVADLASTMQNVYDFVDAIEAVPSKIKLLENIIQRIFTQTVECAIFIREYGGHGFAERILRETMGATTPAKVAGMARNLISLRQQFDTGVAIQTATITFRTHKDVTALLKNQTLGLLSSSGVHLGNLPRCLPGTRRVVIDEILQWALHPPKGDDSNVLWLYGVAGIGKTAVAATVATLFSEMGRLGAFVGFDRASSEPIRPSTAVEALARQMAEHDERLGASIIQTINDRPQFKAPVLEAPLSEQFDRLIVKTFASIPALAGEGPIIIVLDSLDACRQPDDQESLLDVLVGQTESLPSNLRFIITSRTVNDIYATPNKTVLHPRLQSRELRSSSHSDISAYFTFQMEQIRRNKNLQEDWQGPTAIAELADRAFGLFAWAVNAKTFVDAHCPPERLKFLLLQPPTYISGANPPLDELYRAALSSAGDWTDAHFVSDFRAIMGAIMGSPVAISETAINRLLDRPLAFEPPVIVTIRRLGSVLSYGPVVQVLHPSFLDFLSSPERCGHDINWYFELEPVRSGVSAGPAALCLQRMSTGLKRNMYGTTLSARLTTQVLPEELAYACESWAGHICTDETLESREMVKCTAVFLHGHLLHWFEAMSIMAKSGEIAPMLQRVATWLERNTFEDRSLKDLVIEAIDFARKFAVDIAEHPLYFYYVALPLCPSHSMLHQLLHDSLVDPLVPLVPLQGPVGINAQHATLCLRIMNASLKRNMGNMMLSAHLTTEVLPEVLAHACQSWVVHICTVGTFGPWTMELLAVFLRTHLLHWFEAMSMMAKSEEIVPMLRRVATWLEENTFEDKILKDIVIEAIEFARKFAAEIAAHPLHVYYTALPLLPSDSVLYQLFHDSLVEPSVVLVPPPHGQFNNMAISTDGLQLVTGYAGTSVWDTATGKELLKMAGMDGSDCLMSVEFSYDGSHIACGTDESTVYVWDSVSGARVIGPLSHSGLSKGVCVVAWSTNGQFLLSGCTTGEVILWNVTFPKGSRPIQTIHHPGCSDRKPLISVALSSDGAQIVSCSQQAGVYVWDSQTGGIVWSAQDPQGYDTSSKGRSAHKRATPVLGISVLSQTVSPAQ
ncbi:hypothetical protein FIBSPDRAFT_974829 [Athelia psychrophila]|uniref:Nephrocystin 3-like N-terminal domain-containing protein n=1 Tax=Athelia psychrophila TaxID=1759441 RepID=A0A166U654_9AGAM|nr:hypothetical protein FIBSPDRAFT_974829 [Fibularhizoctonia sp. CBS 109695]